MKNTLNTRRAVFIVSLQLYLCPQAFSSFDWMRFSLSLAPTYDSIVEVKLVMPCCHTAPPHPNTHTYTPSVVRLPSAQLARVGLFLAELLWKLQSSTDRFAHTPLCWQTLGVSVPMEPSLRPILCRIHVICPSTPSLKLLPCYNRNSYYCSAMLMDLFGALEPIWFREDLASSWFWFGVAWILKVSVRQMAYFWPEIMLLVGNGSTGHQIRTSWVWYLPGFELTQRLGL